MSKKISKNSSNTKTHTLHHRTTPEGHNIKRKSDIYAQSSDAPPLRPIKPKESDKK